MKLIDVTCSIISFNYKTLVVQRGEKINEPLPNYLWKDAAKLRVG